MGFGSIPARMKEYNNWLLWRLEDKGRPKPDKVPYSAHGGHGKVNDPATWAAYEQAMQAYLRGGYNGLGFVLNSTPLVGVDIDGCIDQTTGEITPEAVAIIEKLDSYTEISQSGTGVHIIIEGKLPGDRRRNGPYEMYGEGSNRYFIVTGKVYGAEKPIRADQTAIDTVHAEYFQPQQKPSERPTQVQAAPLQLSIAQLVEKIKASKSGAKFDALWRGDKSAYGDDDSRADMALCDMLAFWCQRDAAAMDEMFRHSGLMRPKWDEKRGACTYGEMTIDEAIKGCNTVYTPPKAAQPKAKQETPAEWEAPIPFDTINTPDFPTECLPAPVAAFVDALAESTQTPTEMGALLSLGVLATAFQARHEVEITPDWQEPLCLYPVAIAPPGERKSAVISAITAPVWEYEAGVRERDACEIEQNKVERDLLEKALARAKEQAVKAKSTEARNEARDEALALADELSNFEDKHPFRLLVDDTTPEKLVDIMDTQKGCITVASAEGGVFDALAGRYDRNANFDVYLKGHAGDPITVDRIGRKPNHIRRPRLTMILTIQPEVLNGLMGNATFRGRGLCGRFLYAVCKSKVGRRNATPDSVPQEIRSRYNQFVRRILSEQSKGTIYLSAAARAVQIAHQNAVEARLADEWEHMRDWGGKLVGAAVRIAALIHAAEVQEDPTETPISAEAMTAAVRIADFLGVHAMAAYQVMGSDETYADAKYLWRRIESAGHDEISKRDLFNLCKSKFKRVDAMEPALQALADMGYIRQIEQSTGGRPTTIIMVNPLSKSSRSSKMTS